ncbi:hypothetical protein, partial [Halalkalibacter lacteus]|uniref:hypothetical protein n=1 Tax=Halalkalibacter lacteus TaxID=3090663 RepID=UPI002FC8CFC1
MADSLQEGVGSRGLMPELSEVAERFIESAALLASLLGEAADVDWSGVVIGYCKATEVEAVRRIVDPFRRRISQAPES